MLSSSGLVRSNYIKNDIMRPEERINRSKLIRMRISVDAYVGSGKRENTTKKQTEALLSN